MKKKYNLGQIFLINENIAKQIVTLLDINNHDDVFEIGSGKGILSKYLLKTNYKTLTLNDIDNNLIEKLAILIKNKEKNTYLIKKSALKINIIKFNKIISNLPYYITSSLLEYILTHGKALKYIFMIQKEVFEKINAQVNTKKYNPLTILINCIGKIRKEFNVSKINFNPIPKVDSIVFSIQTNNLKINNKKNFFLFLKKIFCHKRKTIYNNLFFYFKNKENIKNILQQLKISLLARPQQITPLEYLKIFNLLNE